MKTSLTVGPVLGYENGNFYTVCILTDGLEGTPKLEVAGKKIPFVPLELAGTAQFWRAEFQPAIPAGATGNSLTYAIRAADGTLLADRHDREQWAFYLPGKTEPPLLAYGSCNGFSTPDLLRDVSEPYALWRKMSEAHDQTPFALLLMGGDQVYADQIWSAQTTTRSL